MTQIEDNREMLSALARQAARGIGRSFPMVDIEDLIQEAWGWCAKHPRKLGEYLADENEKHREKMIVGAMRNVCKDYARRERAAQNGSDITDDAWYQYAVLKDELLPALFDRQAWLNPPQPAVKVRGSDPSEGNNWVTTLADVKRAYDSLGLADQKVLWQRYAESMQIREIADEWKVSVGGAHNRVRDAIKHIQEFLGGFKPHDDPPEEDLDEFYRLENQRANDEVWQNYVGSRHVISNAHARALARKDYKGD